MTNHKRLTLAASALAIATLAGCGGSLVTGQRPGLPASSVDDSINCEVIVSPGRVACLDSEGRQRGDWFTYAVHDGAGGWYFMSDDMPALLQGDSCPQEDSCHVVWDTATLAPYTIRDGAR